MSRIQTFGILTLTLFALPGMASAQHESGTKQATAAHEPIGIEPRLLGVDCDIPFDLTKASTKYCTASSSCYFNRALPAKARVCVAYTSDVYGKRNMAFVFDRGRDYLLGFSKKASNPNPLSIRFGKQRFSLPFNSMTSLSYDAFGAEYYHYGKRENNPSKCSNLWEQGSYCSLQGYSVHDARGIEPNEFFTVSGTSPVNGR